MAGQRLSVAMCTYNGAPYLKEQLDSIAAQIRHPDELVVCDDRSMDSTLEIVKAFSSEAAFPVRVVINEKNLGSTKNFENAIGLCRGNIIALSDQDDVWSPEKLMLIERVFHDSPEAGVLFTDAEVVDESLRPLGYRLWQVIGFNAGEQKKVASGSITGVLLKHNVAQGATLAFRAKFRELVLPIPPDWGHEAWITLLIAARADAAIIGRPLIKYRQHYNQQLGVKKVGLAGQITLARRADSNTYINELNKFTALRDRLLEHDCDKDDIIKRVEAKMAHLLKRANMPKRKLQRLAIIVKELATFRYHLYSNGWKSALKDFFLN